MRIPISNSLLFMVRYAYILFYGKKISLDQYKGSYDHSAYTQYTRKEVFLAFF
jgi:hypothetical protein